ncbi:hypothetical protein CPC08DRAFT_466896 [Agrocybe pediades]|nr:hypothetical protein CPC08DRAFT_466896 [Agrocybe pediades]
MTTGAWEGMLEHATPLPCMPFMLLFSSQARALQESKERPKLQDSFISLIPHSRHPLYHFSLPKDHHAPLISRIQRYTNKACKAASTPSRTIDFDISCMPLFSI